MKLITGTIIAILIMVGMAFAEPPEPKTDWQLEALTAQAENAALKAELAKATETLRVMQSWIDGKFQVSKMAAIKGPQQALRDYRKTLEEKEAKE